MLTEYPLTKAHRIRLAEAFKTVRRVDLSITCILEAQMGKAFVDQPEQPTLFKLQTGPFCYLAGDARSAGGSEWIRTFPPYTFLMPSAPGWLEAAQEQHSDRLCPFPRYSFSAERLSRERLASLGDHSPYQDAVERIDLATAAQVRQEPDSFVDLTDFDSPEDFIARGIGYCVRAGGKIVGAAYSSLVCSQGIEVSLFVEPEHRRKGMATVLASHLLSTCLEHGMEPHWDAANPESCELAEKLGYIPAGTYTAYYLREN